MFNVPLTVLSIWLSALTSDDHTYMQKCFVENDESIGK